MECYNHQVGNFKSKERLLDCVLPGVVLRPRDSLCSAQGYPAGKFGLPGNMGAVWGGVPCALPPRVRRRLPASLLPPYCHSVSWEREEVRMGYTQFVHGRVTTHTHTHTHTPVSPGCQVAEIPHQSCL